MEREYNMIYGWLPKAVIAHLSMEDRGRLFIDWLTRKPTNTGYLIVSAVVKELGDDFLVYMASSVAESLLMVDEEVTKETVLEGMEILLESFATDVNILYEYVSNYRTEALGVDEDDLSEFCNPLKSEDKKPDLPTQEQVAESKVTTSNTGALRDSVTGRFIKKRR